MKGYVPVKITQTQVNQLTNKLAAIQIFEEKFEEYEKAGNFLGEEKYWFFFSKTLWLKKKSEDYITDLGMADYFYVYWWNGRCTLMSPQGNLDGMRRIIALAAVTSYLDVVMLDDELAKVFNTECPKICEITGL